MSDLKKVIRQEYLKCATDPVHFMRKYCYKTGNCKKYGYEGKIYV